MRILYFSQLFYPAFFGGGEYIFYHWAKELVKQGHEVYVITQKLKGSPSTEIIDGITIYRVGAELDLSPAILIGISSSISFIFSSLLTGVSVCRKKNIDVIHSNTYIPVISAQICASICHLPHVATVHDVYHASRKDFWKQWSSQDGAAKSMKRLGPLMEKVVCSMPVKKFHTVSNESKLDMQKLGIPEEKIEVIPNGIATYSYEVHTVDKKPHQAAYIGRLVFYKNIVTVIDAFEEVIKLIPDATLVIAGDGPEKTQLERKAEKLGKHILFRGNISEEAKIQLISESAVLLNPSTIEGFGIVVLEGFACSRPVLVSNVKPLSDLVIDSVDGFAIDAYNPNEWAEKISRLMINQDQADRMGSAGKKKVEQNYSISNIVRKLVEMYSVLQ